MLNNVLMRSSREFRIAVCAANSVAGCGLLARELGGVGVSSQPEGVDGRAGVPDWFGVEVLPVAVDDRGWECVPGKGRLGRTETGRRMTFLNDARKFDLSFSRMTFPRIPDWKSSSSI